MGAIRIEGVGDLQVPDEFKTWNVEQQDAFIEHAIQNKPNNTQPNQPPIEVDDGNEIVKQVQSSPEAKELVDAFNALTPEQQAQIREKSSTTLSSKALAAGANILDNILPVPVLWLFGPEINAAIDKAEAENPGIAKTAAYGTTVLSLVGFSLLGGLLRGGVKILRKAAVRKASHQFGKDSAEYLTKQGAKVAGKKAEFKNAINIKSGVGERAAQAIKDDAKQAVSTLAVQLSEEQLKYDQVASVVVKLKSLVKQKLPIKQRRLEMQEIISLLPKNHAIWKFADESGDLFVNKLDKLGTSADLSKGYLNDITAFLSNNVRRAAANKGATFAEIAAGLTGNLASTWTYSKQDWKQQGFTDEQASALAWKYVLDIAPIDVVAAAIDPLFGGGFASKVLAGAVKGIVIGEDLNPDTGKVRPDVYGYKPPVRGDRAGLLSKNNSYADYTQQDFINEASRRTGGVGANKGGLLSDKVSKVYKEGYKAPGQAYAIAKSMGYNQGGFASSGQITSYNKRGGIPNWARHITARDVLSFAPVVGDLIAAQDVVRELQKPNPNWLVVGALAGATIIGFIPGIGDAAALAIRKGAKQAGKLTADAVGHGRNLLDFDPAFVGRGKDAAHSAAVGARPAATQTFRIEAADGTVELIDTTYSQLMKEFGATKGARKNGSGKLNDGAVWSNVKADHNQFVDPFSATFKEQGAKAVKLPASITTATGRAVMKDIDAAIEPHFNEASKRLTTSDDTSGLLFHPIHGFEVDDFIDEDTVLRNTPTIIDNKANKVLAREIAEAAWPDIVKSLDKYKNLGAERYNAIVRYAKQQSQYIFSFAKSTSRQKEAAKRSNDMFATAYKTPLNKGFLDRNPRGVNAHTGELSAPNRSMYDAYNDEGLLGKGGQPVKDSRRGLLEDKFRKGPKPPKIDKQTSFASDEEMARRLAAVAKARVK